VVQQKGSAAQIAWQQFGSEQPRPLCAKQQLCRMPHCARALFAEISASAIATMSITTALRANSRKRMPARVRVA